MLLRAIAEKTIPGIADNMRILLVTQIVESESSSLNLSLVQAVVKADSRRESVREEYDRMWTLYTAATRF